MEVLVALVVFAVAAVALAAAYINVLNAYDVVSRGDAYAEDVRFARAQLLAEPDRKKVEEGADFELAAGGRLRWHATVETTDTADLFRVNFVCDISPSGVEKTPAPVNESFMLLRPTWSEGIDTTKLRQAAKDRILELRKKLP